MDSFPWQTLELLRWQDLVDIALLTLLLSRVYAWLRGTFAIQVAFGMLVILAGAFAAREVGLVLTSYVLQGVGAVATLIAVVVFRDEIRRALARANPLQWWQQRKRPERRGQYVALAEACFSLARRRIGALVVIPRAETVRPHLSGGTELDSALAAPLIESVFLPRGPLHDGALVIERGRLTLAGAVLPLSRSLDLPDHHGTRHRAALGLTEICDAVVVCVSEERATVSVAADETLRDVHSAEELGRRLDALCRQARRADSLDDRAGRSPGRTRRDVLAYALIAAGVVTSWYTMAGSRFHVVARQVPIEFRNLSENLALEPPSEDKVLVELRGPSHLLESLQPGSLSAFVDLSQAEAGVQEVPVEGTAPSGVHVVSVVPSEIRIEVLERRSIPVRATAGSLFPSEMEVVAVTPEQVQVVGTPGAFADIEAITTEPVTSRDIDGDVARVKLRVPSGLRLVDQRKQDAVVLLRRTTPPDEPPEL